MPQRQSVAVLGTLLMLAAAVGVKAGVMADAREVSIEVTTNPVEGPPRTACEDSQRAEKSRQEWWIALMAAEPSPGGGPQGTDSAVACGRGSYDGGPTELAAGAAYLIAELSTFAGLMPAMLIPERVLVLDIQLELRKLSGFGEQGEPLYRESEERRKFYFLDGGEASLPLLVANNAEEETFGMRELFLTVAAGPASEGAAATYGVVRITSSIGAGELLLDGGVAGSLSPGLETVVANVATGLREVGVRTAAEREIRKRVRVESGRTVLVELSTAPPEDPAVPYRLEPLGENAKGYEEYRRASDGAVVVRIPAGEFLMGNAETEGSPLEHMVHVSEFLIDKLGVTWGQYKRYAEKTGLSLPPRDPYWGIRDDHPVVFVTWEEAKAYCEWAGGRLPTEAEREKASRGTDRRKYPWGDEEPAPHLAVFRSSWGFEATAPVGLRPEGISPYGVHDMGGNVWEWCSDWWDRDYFEVSPYRNPKGPASGIAHVLKGGSWDSRPSVLSSSSRNFGHRGYRELDFGFRCAMNAPR